MQQFPWLLKLKRMLFQQATKTFIINYGNNSDTFLDMSLQYKTVLCLQLKCIPRKETKRMHMDIFFLFSVLCSNKQFFKIACSQTGGGGRRWLTKDLGVGVKKTCFSPRSWTLVKMPQWKKPSPFNILKPKSFDLIPAIQMKLCFVIKIVFQATHSLIFFYGLRSQKL